MKIAYTVYKILSKSKKKNSTLNYKYSYFKFKKFNDNLKIKPINSIFVKLIKMYQILSSFNGILVIKLICKYLTVSKTHKKGI